MTDTEYIKIFNACSTQNLQAASRDYFPLPELSRKIERDSARRVPYSWTRVMLKLGRRARGYFVTFIKIAVDLINCTSGHVCVNLQVKTSK